MFTAAILALSSLLFSALVAEAQVEDIAVTQTPEGVVILNTAALDVYRDAVADARRNCGPVSLWYCLKRLGVATELDDVIKRSKKTADGTSLANLVEAGASYGVHCRVVSSTGKDPTLLPIPAILVVNETHCLVFDGVDGDGQLRFVDPGGLYVGALGETLSDQHIRKALNGWSGEAIIFSQDKPGMTNFGLAVLSILPLSVAIYGLVRVLRVSAPSV